MKKVLSIAGSDSGGGAGIQADLKTFAAYRVHGMTSVTAITAQNTLGVTAIQGIDPEIIRAQIEAVVSDIGVDTAKTGMLHSAEVIETVSDMIKKFNLRTVVDPVMVSTSGSKLLKLDAKNALVELLIPLAEVITPNVHEAEIISGVQIETITEAKNAAEIISRIGSKAVLIKGGHLKTPGKAVDILYHNFETTLIEGPFHETKNTHGTGCSLSSAIAAELAYGKSIIESVKGAKNFVNKGILQGLEIGKGLGPVNPMASLYDDAERYKALEEVRVAVARIETVPELRALVSECQMNVGVSLSYAKDAFDIVAVDGRLTKHMDGVKTSGCPRFGASRHISSTILAVREYDKTKRAAMNLRYSEDIVRACQEVGLAVSYYDRREEPEEIKNIEGMTTRWGSREAVKRIGKVPDALYHLGDWGKEPMVVLLGESADQVVEWAIQISRKIRD